MGDRGSPKPVREISLKAARAAEVDAVADTVSDTATDMNTETARPL
jgi:ribosomal protein S10